MKKFNPFQSLSLLVLACLIISASTTNAQNNQKIDSLQSLLKNAKHDTVSVRLIIEIGSIYQNENIDSSFLYFDKGLKQVEIAIKSAKKQDIKTYTSLKGSVLEKMGIVYYLKSNLEGAKDCFQKSFVEFERILDKKGMSLSLMDLGVINNAKGNSDDAIVFFNKSISLKEEIGDSLGIAKCYHNIGIAYYNKGDVSKVFENFDKTLKIYERLGNQNLVSNILNTIGSVYELNSDYNKAIDYLLKSAAIKEKIRDRVGVVDCYNRIAHCYKELSEFDKAIDYINKSQVIAKEINLKNEIAYNYRTLGNIYNDKGLYDKALENFFASLKVYEELSDKTGISACYNSIGNTHNTLKDYKKAIEYLMLSLKIKEELGNKNSISNSYNNIGLVYIDLKEFDKALIYLNKAREIWEENGNKSGLSSCYNNIGLVYNSKNNLNKAIEYYQKAEKILNDLGDKNGISTVYENIASLNIKFADSAAFNASQKNEYLQKALEYGHKAFRISEEIGSLSRKKFAANALMDIYKKQGNYKEAFRYAEINISAVDSMFKEEKTKAIAEMQTKYETEKKQQEIEKQQLTIEKQEIDNKRQRNLRNFFIVGSALLAILALVVLNGYQQKKRSNSIITEKNAQLEQANEEISAQRDLVTEQKERIEVIHEELMSSIRYAKRIQNAVLPAPEQMEDILGDHFVLFKPKDIVSGDFYWATKVNNYTVFCVADCTGHGVPGAFMSMLGVSFINDIIHKEKIIIANEILNRLRISVVEALKQRGEGQEQKDGMDMGLCIFDNTTRQLQFAGGYNPCWVIPNPMHSETRILQNSENIIDGDVIQLKPDKMPIAIYKRMEPFTNQVLQLYPGDQIYLMSDGFQDQFGGIDEKKFMVKNLRDLVARNSSLTMVQQKNKLELSLNEWKGETEQVDDITILGVRV